MKKQLLFIFSIFYNQMSIASQYSISGLLENKILNYTEAGGQNFGNQSFFQFEQRSTFSKSLIGLNQLMVDAISTENDIHSKTEINKSSTFDTYLGENYIRYQSNRLIIQVGYQNTVWGESFGFNYADLINPKNDQLTFYDELGKSRIPILLVNSKIFFEYGSIQIVYSPRPQFTKTLPIDLFIGDLIPQPTIKVNKQSIPTLFKENDYGLKLSTSVAGFDLSAFYFDHLNRNPFYTTQTVGLSNIELNENHERVTSGGVSVAKTAYDFVLRSDLIFSKNREFNSFNNMILDHYKSNVTESLIGIDTPSFNKFTSFFILAHKTQSTYATGTFTPKTEDHGIIKISKSLDDEKKIELVYTHEFKYGGKSLQTLFMWPITSNTELKLGSEIYFGSNASNLEKLKKLNNVFFSLKNYFQI